mgnify:CR=1 FL=1
MAKLVSPQNVSAEPMDVIPGDEPRWITAGEAIVDARHGLMLQVMTRQGDEIARLLAHWKPLVSLTSSISFSDSGVW